MFYGQTPPWPTGSSDIMKNYGACQAEDFHAGVDIEGTPSATIIKPIKSGTIKFARHENYYPPFTTFFLYIQSDDNPNEYISYQHIEQDVGEFPIFVNNIFVCVGEHVTTDTKLGKIRDVDPNRNNVSVPHVHLGVQTLCPVVVSPTYTDLKIESCLNPLIQFWNNTDPGNSIPTFGPIYIKRNTSSVEFTYVTYDAQDPGIFNKVKICREITDDLGGSFTFPPDLSPEPIFDPDIWLTDPPFSERYYGMTSSPWSIEFAIKDYNNDIIYPSDVSGIIFFDGNPKPDADMNIIYNNEKDSYTNGIVGHTMYYNYWLTNLLDGNTYEDRYWNTKLKESSPPQPWYGDDANNPEECKYPDGIYTLETKASDLVHPPVINTEEVIVNNFRPFIKDVKITQQWIATNGTGPIMTIYDGEWSWNGSNYIYQKNEERIAKTEGDLTVIITTSEPMETLQLEILSLGFNSSGSPVNSNRTEWEFLVPESTVTGAHILSIDGYDYANTQIESLNSTLTSYTVPTRDVNGNWIPDNPGLDTRHMFSSQLTLIEFIASENVICPGDEVTFTNLSAGYDDTYEWDWRFYYSTGGGCGVSNLINPEPYTYPLETAFGFYDVVVRIYEPGIGLVDKMTKEDFIEVVDPSTFLDADFDAEIDGNKGQLYGNSPLTVNFTDISTGTPNTWNWDFDGNYGSSSLQNPTFTYENNTSEAIQYSVSLVTCNNTNCDEIVKENLITVYPEGVPQNPIANFTYNQPSILSPSYVSFTNTSSGIITNYSWYIDNIEVSDDQTLSPRFFNTTSIVKLLVSDGTNSDQIERTISVYNNPGSGVMADFTWEPEEIIKGDFVMFCENVSGFYYNYYCNWIFEEPRTGYVWTSFMHNPTEIFTEAGIYKVTLEVYDTWDFINLIGVCQKNVEVISQNGFPTLADNEFNGGDPPASDGANDYGISVAINDNFAFVGASAWGYADHRDGWVFVYEFDEINETWSEFQTLISPENNDWWSDEFGFDIDVSNEWLVIGAPGHNWNQPPTGIAYVYKYLKSATTY